MANENNRRKFLSSISKNATAICVIVAFLMLLCPVHKTIIDLMMIINLSIGFLVLLTVVYTARASSLSSFPQIVNVVTVFGVGINVASTKLILAANASNPNALKATQSTMVQAFSNIVAGNNLVIGFIVFVVLIVFQFVVITKGAGRVSEVAARFTLDSMSVKFMDIDSQASNGAITHEEAEAQKEQLRRDIDFYSNMDGSSKFVSGNVVFGIFMTVLNLVGGFIIGIVSNHLTFQQSLDVYSKLTIGDGLMSQMPSLMLSLATGLLVTADKTDETLDEKISKEFAGDGLVFQIIGGILCVMGVVFRNGTQFLLLPVGGLLIYYGFSLKKKKAVENQAELTRQAAEATDKNRSNDAEKEGYAHLDPLCLEIGYALIPLVDKDTGAELVERITSIRREASLDIGLPVPKIRIVDNMNLDPNEYCFKIRGISAGKSQVRLGYYMCMDTGTVTEQLKGEATKDPAFGMPAIWLPEDQRSEAEQAGYTIVDPPTIVATHITEIIRSNAADILGREEVNHLIEQVQKTNPIVVKEVTSGERAFSIGEIEKILKELLREKVSIRNMVTILEAISDGSLITKNPWMLVEKVREALGSQICLQYADSDSKLRVIVVGQKWSSIILEHSQDLKDGSSPFAALDGPDERKWKEAVSNTIVKVNTMGFMPVIMCPSQIRRLVHNLIDQVMPGVVVLSEKELIAAKNRIDIEVLGEITYED